MERSKTQKVKLYRDMREEGWRSMDRYADNLLNHLNAGSSDSFSFSDFAVKRSSFIRPTRVIFKFIPIISDYWSDRYFSRYLKYPISAFLNGKSGDIAHVLDQSYAHLLYSLRERRKVASCHDLIPLEYESNKNALRAFIYSVNALRYADIIIASSKATRLDLTDRLNISPEKIRVVPLGVDLTRFRRVENNASLSAVKIKYGLPEGKILFQVANNLPYKNIERTLEALALIRKRAPEPFYFFRAGKLTEAQITLAKKLGIADLIIEKSYVDDADLPSLYSLSSLTINPSLKEGFGFPVLESLACGTPVLVSSGTSLEEITGKVGILVDPLNTETIARAIFNACFNYNAILHGSPVELRARAEKFSWKRTADETIKVYSELL